MRYKAGIIAIIMLFGLGLTGCNKKTDIYEEIPLLEPVSAAMDTVSVTKGDISVKTVYQAKIVPFTQSYCFDNSGCFGHYLVSMGEEVTKGQKLAVLNGESQETQMEQLKGKQQQVKDTYTKEQDQIRQQIKLLELQIQDCDINLKTEYEKQIEILQEQLEYSNQMMALSLDSMSNDLEKMESTQAGNQILAQIDGRIVGMASLSQGDSIGPDTVILTIADDSRIYISTDYISESEIATAVSYVAFIDGKETEITYEPIPLEEKATMVAKGIPLQSKFTVENSDLLQIGKTAVICVSNLEKKDVLCIPLEAVYFDKLGSYVYLIHNETRIRQNVVIGLQDISSVEILEGLKEGDEVYVKE